MYSNLFNRNIAAWCNVWDKKATSWGEFRRIDHELVGNILYANTNGIDSTEAHETYRLFKAWSIKYHLAWAIDSDYTDSDGKPYQENTRYLQAV